MPDMPRTKFNSPWTVENIEAELNGTKSARGALTMTEKLAQKVETSTYATDKAAIDAEIAAVANAGAKNLFNIDTSFTSATRYHATASMSEGMISAAANGSYARIAIPYTFKSGASIFSCRVSSYILAGSEISLRFATSADSSGAFADKVTVTGNGIYTQTITVQDDTAGYVILHMNNSSSSNANSADFSELMIRRAEIKDDTFVPYAPSARELYEMILALQNGA